MFGISLCFLQSLERVTASNKGGLSVILVEVDATPFPFPRVLHTMKPEVFETVWQLDEETRVTIRPIRPEDSEIEQNFVRSLSPQSRYFRFFTPLKELSPQALEKFTRNVFPTNMALIATTLIEGRETQIGVARFGPGSKSGWGEFAICVADAWHGRGIATRLLQELFEMAKDSGLSGIEGYAMNENVRMLRLARQLGFSVREDPDDARLSHLQKVL